MDAALWVDLQESLLLVFSSVVVWWLMLVAAAGVLTMIGTVFMEITARQSR